jgi:copper binding protein CusF
MGTARIIFAGAAAIGILMSAAYAEDDMTGMVTQINRLNSTIAIQPMQKGTVGASAGSASGPIEEFKAKDAAMLDSVHAGDRVTFTTTDAGGAKTLTKLQRQ